MSKFQERLRELRGSSLQDEFAAKIGISRTSLSYYENGNRIPDIDTLTRIHEVTGVSIYYLLGLTDSKDDAFATTQRDTGFSEKALQLFADSSLFPDCINILIEKQLFEEACTCIATIYNDYIHKRNIQNDAWTPSMEKYREETIQGILGNLLISIEKAANDEAATPIPNIDLQTLPYNQTKAFVNRIHQNLLTLRSLKEQGDWNNSLEQKLHLYETVLNDMTNPNENEHSY